MRRWCSLLGFLGLVCLGAAPAPSAIAPSPAAPTSPSEPAVANPAPIPSEPSEPPAPPKFVFAPPAYRVLEDAVDPPLYVLDGNVPNGRVLVYLHGYCGDINAIGAFAEAATTHATVITLRGDQPCPDKPGRFKWSRDIKGLDQRIQRALGRVAAQGRVPIDRADVTLMGYSQGALRAESLARFYGGHYRRVVLGGPPERPSPRHFPSALAIAVVGGEKEDTADMQRGTLDLQSAGKLARFFLLPGVDHGEFGAEGNRVMSEALGFVLAPSPASPASPVNPPNPPPAAPNVAQR
jgi:pimeloyl-ACP methyl ester carboxylesterase